MKITPEDIYSSYPRKVARGDALKAINRALKKVGAKELMEKVRTYASMIQWKERQFIPHCSTWMNQERWLDDPVEWEQPKPRVMNIMEVRMQMEALDAQIKSMERRGHEDAFGLTFQDPNDRRQWKELKRQRRELGDKLLSNN